MSEQCKRQGHVGGCFVDVGGGLHLVGPGESCGGFKSRVFKHCPECGEKVNVDEDVEWLRTVLNDSPRLLRIIKRLEEPRGC